MLNKNQRKVAGNEKKLKSGVHESFAAWAAAQPDALAVAWSGGVLSYGELNARANRLARHLRGLGVGPDVVVGVLARRSPEMLVALLAVLKAGGAYLPLDPAYPEERLATTLEDAGARLLLSTAELLATRPAVAAAAPFVFRLGFEAENEEENLAALSAEDLPGLSGPENLAYVIYTSGSTGRPKGVEVEHRGLTNLVDWHRRTYAVTPADRATRLAGSAFDASVWEVWPYLASGASLHLPADDLLLSPPDLAAWLAREEITLCFLPTPLAEAVLDEPWQPDAPLRALLTGGDRLHRGPSPEHPFGLYNHYGPTENSVVTTWCRVPPGSTERPPIGLPIDGVTARRMGSDLLPVAAGEEGELWTGGLSLARGYRGRPDLTAERFVPDPSAVEPGARLYRTGDLVRELPDGDLDFVGRIDFQVKVRGFRIELGEIEVALRRHPQVRDGVVLARDDGRGGKRLAGYVVPRGGAIPEADLAAFLGRTLPEYMVPTAWVTLAALPLTPNGKVDRAALPEPERERGALAAPRTAQEAELAAIFAEVLRLDQVGIDEDFFALGGHSLQATQVVSRLRARLGAALAPGALFTHPTVEDLALVLGEGAETDTEWEIRPFPRAQDAAVELPLSFAQHRLWMAERWSPEPALYNTPFALDLAGALDVPVLLRAVAEILARHETLRATFREVDGQPLLEVRRRAEAALPVCDLAGLPAGAREAEAERITAQEAHRAFDLARGPLLRTVLLRLGAAEHRLLALMHHIVSDDWSISVLVRELSALYTAFAQGRPSPLPPLPVQYGDFAAWQRRWLAGPVLARQLAWWKEALAPPLPVLDLPADRPRPALLSFRGARQRRLVPRGRVEALAALGRRADSSLFMVLLAAFDVLLARSTGTTEGTTDVLVGSPIANRHRVEVEELIGFFVNTLPLRARVEGGAPFPALLAAVRATLLGAYEHQDLPFERLLEELAPARDPSRNPLIDVMVILANALRLPERLGPELALGVRELEVGVAKVDLSLFLEEGAEGMAAIWEYNTALFDGATIERMAARFETLLAGIATAPEAAVGELPLLTAAERDQLATWNHRDQETARERPAELAVATLASLFAAQARRTPDALALVAGEAQLTYGELAARVATLAGHLRHLGVGPEVPVAIFLPRRAELVVALLAVHAAGGFYVPLDPAYPAERSAFMLADSGCALVLTVGEVADRLPAQAAPVLRLDEAFPPGEAAAESAAAPGNLAYVIYTSGSTGRPKAVAIEHRSAVVMLAWARREYSDRELSGMLASTSITFDISVFEIFAPLAWGGTVILAENALALASLPPLPAGVAVRVLDAVPSAVAELLRMDGLPASVETVNLAGEAVPRSLADRLYARPHVERVYNLYGPSEDTTFSTWALLERAADRPPAIGRPLDGTQVWLLDARFQVAPIGVAGEVYLGGAGLSRGYLGRPELTAERFVPSPFGPEGERLYRTGDLARYRPDGVLEFLGRIDHQVKVRGFRIELGEVESALAAVAGVESAAVMAREDAALGTHLAAWVVAKGGGRLEVSALRAALRARLPESMVPTAWRLLDALPRTANGKVDRRALLALAGDAGEAAPADLGFLAPRGPVEEVVAAIFAEVLGLERVGARDDFFALGGQSLLATRVVSRLRRAFAVEAEVRTLLERPTVEALAAWVSAARRGGVAALPPVMAREAGSEEPPLSFAQERLWFLYQLAPRSTLYNLPMVLRLDGPLRADALAAALAGVERRHAVLRTVFAVRESPVQVVLPPAPPPLPRVDLAGLPPMAREAEAGRLAREESRRPFDLARGPVWRYALLRLGGEEHRLLVSLHHIAADGWSVEVLLRELAALYTARAPLADLTIQYADYAAWQRRSFGGAAIGREAAYWREALAGAPFVLDLPADRPRPPVPSHRGGLERTAIGGALETAARELARRSAATPFIVFLAAFQALLGRYTGAEDVLVGSPVAGRGQVEREGLIGLFINTLVLRGRLAGDPGFAELVARVREAALAAFVHQELPFEKLVEELAPERDFSRSPVFQVLFLFQDRAPATRELAPGLRLRVEETAGELAKFDLKLALDEDGGGLAAFWEYATDLFEPATVRRLGGHFINLLAGAVESPETRLAELPLLGPEELRQVLRTGSPAAADGRLIHQRFAAWARRTPEAPAVTCEGEVWSFRRLAERASRLAHRLRRLGVGPETVVALACERSCGMAAALLGVLEAGGAYLPLDPAAPAGRLAFQLADSGARVLVADAASADRFQGISLPLVTIDAAWTALADESPEPFESGVELCHLAYVVYTSGSTGRPKGVMVEHGNLASYLDGVLARMDLPEGASYATVSTLAADLGNTVIFAALATGGLLHVLAGDRLGDPLLLAEYFAAHPVDALKIVPSHLAALMSAERPERVLPRRLLVTGGEALTWSLAERVRELAPGCRLLNHYGPTETTVGVLAFPVSEADASARRSPAVPLGFPLGATRAIVVDAHLSPVPPGVAGELLAGGPQLARGYLARPDLTAARFVPDPFAGEPGARLYRTGDLARLAPGGEIEFLGRIDHQVKIRGFRVEPGEIEAALREDDRVREALALVRPGTGGENRLIAYVVPRAPQDGAQGDLVADLRRRLRASLPEALVPSAFVLLAALPLTANGKVDRQALSGAAGADPEAAEVAGAPLRPLTQVEEVVAGIFAQLLGMPFIADPDADFFELGGHSLLATRALSRLRRAFGIDFELRTLFDERTVSRLARRIAERAGADAATPDTALQVFPESDAGMPLSFAQQRLWFLDRLLGASATYNIPWVLHLHGPLAPAAIAAALDEIARRHEPLRTVYRGAEGEPAQVVLPWEPRELPLIDVAACAGEAARLAAEWGRRPFDLERGPVFRAALLRLGSEEHTLLFTVHHIAADGWSREILTRELGALHAAFAAGRPSPLPALPTRYAAYAAWQRSLLSGGVLEGEIAFWRGQLGFDPEPLELPADRPRPAVQSGRGALARQILPAGFGAGLERLGWEHRGSAFIASLAAFQALLQRYTGRRELLVGTPVANRDRPEVAGLIGCFVNTLVLRADFSHDPSFLALLGQVRETALAAYAHQELPFERLVEALVPGRDLSRPPLCQVTFALDAGTAVAPLFCGVGGGLQMALTESHSGTAKLDLAVFWGRAAGEETELVAEYATDLFDEATVERLLGHLAVLVAGIEADPEARISSLPLLSEGERAQLAAWNAETRRQAPEESAGWTLHGLFESQAARTPDAVALIVGDDRLSYADLESRSKDLAAHLQTLGVGPEVPVGIFLDRDANLVVALLATLRAGGFYVPLDPAYPADRIGFLLEDSGCRLVLTTSTLAPKLPGNGAGAVRVLMGPAQATGSDEGAHTKEPSRGPSGPAPEAAQPQNLAYLIYTSGSTGRPKAVAIEHRSAVTLMSWSRREFSDLELSGVLASTSISFDMSVFELFAPLCWGGTVILAANALALPDLPAKHLVRVVDTVPSAIAELLRLNALPPSVVTVNLGGEPVPRALADRVYAQAGIERLYNVYGPSEDTTFSTWELIERASERAPSIGRPLDGEQGWVVDGNLVPTPVGVPGELYLGGDGLSRGYLGRPELTAERFVPDPFGAVGARMYRVGDLARYRPDGRLEFLGRIDHQVKIRGFRVELGEVEAALARLPGVEGAAVLARPDAALGLHLVAYVALAAETALGALRDGLRASLPEHMVPAAWKRLDALTLTPNGKVDRRALARIAPEEAAGTAGRQAETPAERRLAELFAGLLGVARVGAEESFFHLGGHSLLAARLVARVRDLFEIDMPLRTVFEAPTVAALARWIEANGGRAMPLRTRPAGARPPASFAQQRLWLLDRLLGATATYNIPAVFHLAGTLRPEALGAALDEIVRRHQVLRTVFRVEDGQPVQAVEAFEPQGLPVIDLAACPPQLRDAEAERLAAEWGRCPFDLERGPLFRAALLRRGAGEHALLVNVHHIAFDGWSHGILIHELSVLYQALVAGASESPLPPLPLQYADYAAWQREWLSGEVLAEQLGFWRAALGVDPEPLELPADRPRPAVPSGRGRLARKGLSTGFGAALEGLARERGGTAFIAFLAAFQALLHRYTGRRELLVGTPVANRDRLEVEGVIGCFVNTLVLRADLAADPSFLRLLDQMRETAFAAYAHQDLPFERLVEELVPSRDLSRPPLCQVTFALDQGKPALPSLGDGVRATSSSSHSGTAKFDLAVYLDRSGDRAELLAEYATDLFDEATIERLLGHLEILVAGIEADPQARISALPLLSAGEHAQLVAWNAATRRQPSEESAGCTLHALFEAQAVRTPDAVALIVGEERLTYADLESRSKELAAHLQTLGVGPEVPVGIFLDRDANLVVALLATLRAGGFYVPLDPAYPSDRIGFMLEDSGCGVVLTTESLVPKLPRNGAGAVRVLMGPAQATGSDEGAHTKEPSRGPSGPAPEAAQPNNLAYLIYTSGSTGRPKAVAIEHRSAVTLMSWSRREFSDRELSGMLAATSITFDMSVFELFAPLCWGGTVILAANALALPDLPAKHLVRVVDTVPSAIAELLRLDALPPSVVTVNLGGEPVPRALADRVYAQAGIERLYNVYGPSEDTTFSTWELIERAAERAPSIGRPLDGEQGWVVDGNLIPTPVGVPGELYLGGEGLSRGYLGRPELTAERFVPDPFASSSGSPGSRLYRVGDLARYRPDGRLEFLGRIDHQVKIRGFRVELGEVEAALARLPGVQGAAVLARQDAALGLHLVAYVALGAETVVGALRDGLRASLPEPMVPAAWKRLHALPLTPNGKVDRRALARIAPDEAAGSAGREAETPAERRLAELFTGLLGVARVGAEESFFHLGGHSLLAARLVARVRDLFEIDMPLRTVFEAPTVAALARWIEAHRGERVTLLPLQGSGARPGGSPRHAPASFAQQRLWILDRLLGATATYNIPAVLHLEGALRTEALGAALDEIVRRHEVLRTVYRVEDGEPIQIVQPATPHGLPVIDLSACPEAAHHLATEWGRRPFDLERGPVFRAALLRLAPDRHRLLVNVHHIASDGWSQGILIHELGALYQTFTTGETESTLRPLPLQYADYAAWQRGWLSGAVLEGQIGYWRGHLGMDPEPLELPADRPRPVVQSGRGALARHPLTAGFGDGLERLARERRGTSFMAFLAAFQALLHRYTGRRELLVGTPVANRDRLEVEGLIGCFVNTLVLRADLAADPPFLGLLDQVRETALAAYAHQDLPFERLVEALVPGRDLSRTPLCQVTFALDSGGVPLPSLGDGVRVTASSRHSGTAKFDLAVYLDRSGERPELLAEYATDLFDEETVERLLGHLAVLVTGIEADPEARISALPLLGEEERAQLVAWNEETRRQHPVDLEESTLNGLFAEQAARTPEAVALIVGEERITFADLASRSADLAAHLQTLGVGPEVPVGIFLERDANLVIALLATLQAGGFYVPLDPAYPSDRIDFMLEDSGCQIAVTSESLAEKLPRNGAGAVRAVLCPAQATGSDEGAHTKEPSRGTARPAPEAAQPIVLPNNLAYLIYTSGSTGRPKAVAIEHRSAAILMHWSRREFSDRELSGVLAATSITFDMSVFELFAPLCWGGTVILAANALALPDLPAKHQVRVVDTVPSAIAELLRMGALPPSVTTVNLGGEPVPRTLADRVYAQAGVERLINVYGPSEDTTFSTWEVIERRSERAPAIGRPLDDEQGWVVDGNLQLTPVGVPGELYLGGDGLSRGYLGRPELTAERFVPDPFAAAAGRPGARMYRVGDLARYRPDGRLEFLGRIDHQVKIHGFRVEIGEVEAVLGRLAGVESAVVLARQDAALGLHLAAYLVPQRLDPATLREGARGALPEYMVPTAWKLLDALPLTPNGKVDRRALARLPIEKVQAGSAGFVAPSNALEEALCGLVADLLGLQRVGTADDFFLRGGHSLLAARLVARLRETFGVDLPLRAVFEAPTVASLARRVKAGRRPLSPSPGAPISRVPPPPPPLLPRAGGEALPASFAQQRLWFLQRLRPESPAYNMPFVFRIEGPLRTAALAQALDEIVRRHEVLRTVYRVADGQPLQVVQPFAPRPLPVVDLERFSERRSEQAAWLVSEWGSQPADLERGPILRTSLLRLTESEHLLLLDVHHIASDGWSSNLLTAELGALYRAFAAGLPSPLEPLFIQYADYAVWQREWLQGAVLAEQLAFWRERLGIDPEPLELTADHPRPAVQSGRGAVESRTLQGGRRLQSLARERGATTFMGFLAVFQTLLHRYTGRTAISVGSPVANRGQLETEELIGCFVNTLVLHADLGGDPAFGELLERVRETALSAYAHQDLPFERLVEELVSGRDLSRSPLCQVAFSFQQEGITALDFGSELRVEVGEGRGGSAKFDLALFVGRAEESTQLLAEYSLDLFEGATVQRLLGHFETLLQEVERAPETPLSALPLLSDAERAQIAAWNQETQRSEDSDEQTLHGMFEGQAARTPQAVALIVGEQRLTFEDLDRRSADLALHLQGLGVGPEVPVGIFLERDANLLIALLATLRAGGFYVPMDPAYPSDRIGFMLEDSGCRVVLTTESLAPKLPENGEGAVRAVMCPAQPTGSDEGAHTKEASRGTSWPAPEAALPSVLPNNLAYLIYTSGSTGRPKAVAIEHHSAVVLMRWSRREFSALELSGMLASTSITFDMSVFELFAPLCWGGTVILAANALALPKLPAKELVRVVDTVPSAIAELLRMDAVPRSVVTVNLGGEAVPRALANRVYAQAGIERLINVYGPSEDTTFSTWEPIERESERAPAIGRPLDGEQGWVVDANLELAPVGVPGELYLGGDGLSRGYLGRPELTAERFVPDPFAAASGRPGARMYRVGDLVRYRPDGRLEFLGRIDHQVKIRGFRVELGEVEAALARLPGVEGAAVVARQEAGDTRLVAYVAAASAGASPSLTPAALREALRERLPEFMVPSAFVFLDALPLTPNGKVNRRALPPPDAAAETSGAEYVAPRTPLEELLAEIWTGVLEVERVGIDDPFWDLGGHSLLATRVLARLLDATGVDLPLQALFEHPTVRQLAEAVGRQLLDDGGDEVDEYLAELEGEFEAETQER